MAFTQDPAETRGAVGWFIGAGLFAVLLSFALYTTDESLAHSTRERDLALNLRELRTAQSSYAPSTAVDIRQIDPTRSQAQPAVHHEQHAEH